MTMKYRDNMDAAQQAAFLAELQAEDEAYEAAHAPRQLIGWWREMLLMIWLAAQWEIDGKEFGAPREEWDTERHRRTFCEDMLEAFDPQRWGWLDHKGRP